MRFSSIIKRIPIKTSYKAIDGFPVSSVVLIVDDIGYGYFYIRPSEELVKFLGELMPYGVGPENEVYLKIIKKTNKYELRCHYLDKSRSVLLAVTNDLPVWVRRVKYE